MPKEAIIIPGKKEGKEITLPQGDNLEAMVEQYSPLLDIFLWDKESGAVKPMKGRSSTRDKSFRVYFPGASQQDYQALSTAIAPLRSSILFPWSRMEYNAAIETDRGQRLPRQTVLRQWVRSYQRNYYNRQNINLEHLARSEMYELRDLNYPLLITKGANVKGENALAPMDMKSGRIVETARELQGVIQEHMGEGNWGKRFTITEFPSLEMGQMRLWLSGAKVVGMEPHPLDPYEGSLETLDEMVKATENYLSPRTYRGNAIPHRAVDVARRVAGTISEWNGFNGWIFTGVTSACVASSLEFKPEYLGISEKGRG